MNSALPIDVTAAQVQQYPELVKLLTELSQRITPEGISFQVKQELEQVSENLSSFKTYRTYCGHGNRKENTKND